MNISDEQTTIIAKHMAHAALDWIDFETDGHSHTPECSNWGAFLDDATTLTAALASTPEASDDEREARNAARRMLSRALDGRLLDEVEAMMWATGYRRSPVPADTPSEDERRAIIRALHAVGGQGHINWDLDVTNCGMCELRADAVLAARPTPPEDVAAVTDEMVVVAAKHIAENVADWTDFEDGEHSHDLECTNWTAYTDDARTLLTAALAARTLPETEEWEYGVEYRPGYEEFESYSREHHERQVGNIRRGRGVYADTARVIRRRPAGPWEPVPSADITEEAGQ